MILSKGVYSFILKESPSFAFIPVDLTQNKRPVSPETVSSCSSKKTAN